MAHAVILLGSNHLAARAAPCLWQDVFSETVGFRGLSVSHPGPVPVQVMAMLDPNKHAPASNYDGQSPHLS